MSGIFYYLYNLPNATTGVDDILVQEQAAVPYFVPLILFFVFLVVFLGGVVRQKARTGTADYPIWALMGCLSAFFTALLMSVIQGLVDVALLGVVIFITIFSAVWFLLDRKPQEN
jgi:uncharacterized membrane protein